MYKLNTLQYSKLDNLNLSNDLSLDALVANDHFDKLILEYKEFLGFSKLRTFSFSYEGFLGLLLELDGTIAISKGECEALYEAGKLYEKLGFEIVWLDLQKDGKVNLSKLNERKIDFLFLSSYVMDTFVSLEISIVKKMTSAKIISNGSAHMDKSSDAIYFDNYKLSGYSTSGVLISNEEVFKLQHMGFTDTIAIKLTLDSLKKQKFDFESKKIFLEKLKIKFKDDIYLFVDANSTLEYSLHFGLKDIRARELIRALALHKIFISNGEGCSLGLSRPSRIIQNMGYEEKISRNALSLSFCIKYSNEEIENIVNIFYRLYRQIKVLG